MRSGTSGLFDACDILRLVRQAAESVLESLDEESCRELREAPLEVRRMVHNLAVARVLEVVNLPEAVQFAADGRAKPMLKAYAAVCRRFRAALIGLCSDLYGMHPGWPGLVCASGEIAGVESLPDSSGHVAPEESGFTCVDCHRSILGREPMWSVNVHREVFEDGAISVLQADCHLVLCEDCAAGRDFGRVHVPNVAA
jgi:hypothetical protein